MPLVSCAYLALRARVNERLLCRLVRESYQIQSTVVVTDSDLSPNPPLSEGGGKEALSCLDRTWNPCETPIKCPRCLCHETIKDSFLTRHNGATLSLEHTKVTRIWVHKERVHFTPNSELSAKYETPSGYQGDVTLLSNVSAKNWGFKQSLGIEISIAE